MAERLNQAVDAPAEDQRQALLVAWVDGLSYEEIGERCSARRARCALASSAPGRRWPLLRLCSTARESGAMVSERQQAPLGLGGWPCHTAQQWAEVEAAWAQQPGELRARWAEIAWIGDGLRSHDPLRQRLSDENLGGAARSTPSHAQQTHARAATGGHPQPPLQALHSWPGWCRACAVREPVSHGGAHSPAPLAGESFAGRGAPSYGRNLAPGRTCRLWVVRREASPASRLRLFSRGTWR